MYNVLMQKPYNSLSGYLKAKYGCKVFKVTLDAGLSCPNRDGTKGFGGCAYCESSTLLPKGHVPEKPISLQLAFGIEKVRLRHKAEKFIAYFQINTNTHAPADSLKKMYNEVIARPDVAALAVSTRPDCVGRDVLEVLLELKSEKDLWIELGLQSANDRTLAAMNRGHTSEDFTDAFERISAQGIDVCAHVIIGLPGESALDYLHTMDFISGLGVWGVKFHQLQVVKGTRFERDFAEGLVSVLELDDYARAVVECLEAIRPETVVHRLSGDVPRQYLVAPQWNANKFMIEKRIVEMMASRGTRQGSKFTQRCQKKTR